MPGASVWIGCGVRATETRLLRELAELHAGARRDPGRLARPVRVVVPSRSLRDHVADTLLRRTGGACAGIRVQTHHALALEVHEAAGEPVPAGEALVPLIVRQEARAEGALREGLGALDDGFGAAVAVVSDFLDAGLGPEHAEALDDLLLEGGGSGAARERARALVRVAARTAQRLADGRLGHRSVLVRRARELLEADPEHVLPARAVFLHGYAEATGVVSDLLEALARRRGARALIDHPPDPADPAQPDAGCAFTQRLRERLAVPAQPEEPGGAEPASLELVEAPGAQAEVRAVAARVRALLDEGARPEGIGVVARGLGSYRLAVRQHFTRLGIPFSAPEGECVSSAASRRIRALVDLLRRREATPAERWLDALVAPGTEAEPQRDEAQSALSDTEPDLEPDARRAPAGRDARPRDSAPCGRAGDRDGPRRLSLTARADLRIALHALGAARLLDAAGLDAEALAGERGLPLPVRRGLYTPEADGDEEPETGRGPLASRRRLPADVLGQAVAAARALRERLRRWPQDAPLRGHLEALRALAVQDLGWEAGSEEAKALHAGLERLEAGAPGSFRLRADELALLLDRELDAAGATPLGGAGAGVAVLDVTAARARSFEHLFVVGLNRDVFPRTILEDPLLPDPLRRRLRTVLPDLPVKESGHAEERYLFAQLLSASPRVTLSWQRADDDGRARAPGALVERLRYALGRDGQPLPAATAPGLATRPQDAAIGLLRPAHEHAALAGLYGSREHFGRVLEVALREARGGDGPDPGADVASLARARLAVLCELDPDFRSPAGRALADRPGPYHGFLGACGSPADPRRGPLAVTVLEGMAACPWQTFLRRVLRLEPLPDALEALPALDARRVGSTVHRALEHLLDPARDAAAGTATEPAAALGAGSGRPPLRLEEVLAREPARVTRFSDTEMDRAVRAAAAAVAREEGIALPGFAAALAARSRPYLEAGRALLFAEPDTTVNVLGLEVDGRLDAGEGGARVRTLHFRADLVERGSGGALLTDFKTGRPISDRRRPRTRERDLNDGVASGRRLQAVAYALGAGDPGAAGRYLFLRPDVEPDAAGYLVRADDPELTGAFRHARRVLLDAWDGGTFFPRLVKGKDETPPRCSSCEVFEACLQGDSGARRRLGKYAEDTAAGSEPGDPGRAFRALWTLYDGSRGGDRGSREER